MLDVGRLMLCVSLKNSKVVEARSRSTRPQAASVLQGKTPAQVMQIVPLLFSVCGKAQGAAAQVALHAAEGDRALPDERAIASEAMQEHLWRLMLDWPKLLGLPSQERQFTVWHGLLRKIGNGEADREEFLREFEQLALGMPSAQWRVLDGERMQSWWRNAASPLAAMLLQLEEDSRGGAAIPRLLPAWSAVQAQQACTGRWDAAFAASPDWQGAAAETGAWTYYADAVMLRETAQRHGTALARVLARLLDMMSLADGSAAARLDGAAVSAGEGIAAARTARGLLLHHVRLEGGKVAEYQIVAPTEWNFHPAGAFVQDMRGVTVQDEAGLKRLARIAALSLDPCVAYDVEVRTIHA